MFTRYPDKLFLPDHVPEEGDGSGTRMLTPAPLNIGRLAGFTGYPYKLFLPDHVPEAGDGSSTRMLRQEELLFP